MCGLVEKRQSYEDADEMEFVVGKLILTRMPEEYVLATLPDGRSIRIGVERVSGRGVTLSFEAPPDIVIVREELSKRQRGPAAGTALQ